MQEATAETKKPKNRAKEYLRKMDTLQVDEVLAVYCNYYNCFGITVD